MDVCHTLEMAIRVVNQLKNDSYRQGLQMSTPFLRGLAIVNRLQFYSELVELFTNLTFIFNIFSFLFFSHSAALEDVRSRHHHRRSHHHYAHHAKETSATEVEKAIPTSSIPTSSIHTNVTSVKVMPLTEGKGLSIYYISTYRGRSGLLVRSTSPVMVCQVVQFAPEGLQFDRSVGALISRKTFPDPPFLHLQFIPT